MKVRLASAGAGYIGKKKCGNDFFLVLGFIKFLGNKIGNFWKE